MKKLSWKERISRIEQAPIEMQTMVAKAFLRDDINDEDVQYLFNTDSLEEINELDSEVTIENQDLEEPEGIGANDFTMRVTKPKNNKNYITKGSGGWSTCIKGNPMSKYANVLANCVGYASGRFNEIINLARGTSKCTYTTLNCNAENFIERAKAAGLKTGKTPKVGAIICWQKGKTLSSSDGVGHVGVVEKVINSNTIYTSESCYGGTAFYNATRKNTNGKWGVGAAYKFRGFIYLPTDVQSFVDGKKKESDKVKITSSVKRDENKNQIEVLIDNLRVRAGAGLKKKELGYVKKGYYNYLSTKKADGYTWYEIAKNQWIAAHEGWTKTYLKKVKTETLKKGDKVKIIKSGCGNSTGTGATAYGIGWTRKIIKILKDRKYPYQVGDENGIVGYYKASALKKIK